MNSNKILNSDILDIIFEKRNKAYGAYPLRKYYPERLKRALVLTFITIIVLLAFIYLIPKDTVLRAIPFVMEEIEIGRVKDEIKMPEEKTEIAEQTKKPDAVLKNVTLKQFVNNLEIVPDQVKTSAINNLLPEDVISTRTDINANTGVPTVEPGKTETGGGIVRSVPAIDKNIPLESDAVEVLPAYPGGMEALRKFLQKHLQTPDELESGQTVSVRIKFVVDHTGKLKSFATVLDGGEAYNNEVLRVLKKMPDWIPGKTRGENVSVYYVIPVKFESPE